MRDLIVLALIAGGVYLGLRQVGCVGSGDEETTAAAAAGDEILLTAEMDPAETAPTPDGAGGGAPAAGGRSSAADEGSARRLEAELEALVSGRAPDDPAALAAAAEHPGAVGSLAGAIVDARSEDAKRQWLGLSRVIAGTELPASQRRTLLGKADSAARQALYAPEESVAQTVRAGDSLVRLQKRFRAQQGVVVPLGILRWLNGVSGDLIHPGEELRAPRGPVELTASKRGFWLRVQVGEGILREFPIGIGRQDKTPAESFVLKRPLEHPPWKDPETGKLFHYGDPGYAIGTRWIGFEPNGPHRGLGIHGTNEPDTIGTAASLGCIRLRNEDVEELAELVAPGMTIEILD